MRKLIMFVLSMVFIMSLFSGCSRKQTASDSVARSASNAFVVYNVSEEKDAVNENSSEENSLLWTLEKSTSQGNNTPQNLTVTFEGKSYTGEYWYSTVTRHNPYTSHYYLFSDGWFSVKSTTAEVDCILFTSPSQADGNKSVDDCKANAVALASRYININDYKLTIETTEEFHSYLFERYVENVYTDAFLSVGIDKNGKLIFFSYGSTEELDAALVKIDKEELKERLTLYTSDDVVDVIRKEQIELSDKNAQIELGDPVLVVLENGDIGVIYDVSVEVI